MPRTEFPSATGKIHQHGENKLNHRCFKRWSKNYVFQHCLWSRVCCVILIFQWLSNSSNVPLVYLLWRCSSALFAGLALLIFFTTSQYTGKNIAKFFIYLTNNGRIVAALALGLEVSRVSVLSSHDYYF